jgi:signal transduction histidine kinase
MEYDNPTILFIDDEPNVLDALRRKLREYDKHWTMIFSHSGVEALEIIGRRAVDVVVTDQTMPQITGLELLHELQIRHPDIIRILLTGNSDQETAVAAINEGKVFRFFTKPCPIPVLIEGIDLAIGSRKAMEEAEKANAKALSRNNAMLRQLVVDLTEAKQELERLSFIAAHDLREPLRQVISYAQLLDRHHAPSLSGEAAEYVQFIVSGVNRMDALTGGFLAYTQIATDHTAFADVNMGRACALALEPLMSDISDSCALVEVSALPSVFGSERAIVQLLRHLIENAIKFRLPMSIPHVRIFHTEVEGVMVFKVADNGIGVEETDHNIFDMFRRLHGHGHYTGHGVGLAICKRIVHHHGGRIWYEANSSGGTIFNFTLPKSSRGSLGR